MKVITIYLRARSLASESWPFVQSVNSYQFISVEYFFFMNQNIFYHKLLKFVNFAMNRNLAKGASHLN